MDQIGAEAGEVSGVAFRGFAGWGMGRGQIWLALNDLVAKAS